MKIVISFLIIFTFATGELFCAQEGKVVHFNEEYSFVIINLGREDGLRRGDRFSVRHNGEEIAIVRAVRIRDNKSACDIEEVNTTSIYQGDEVVGLKVERTLDKVVERDPLAEGNFSPRESDRGLSVSALLDSVQQGEIKFSSFSKKFDIAQDGVYSLLKSSIAKRGYQIKTFNQKTFKLTAQKKIKDGNIGKLWRIISGEKEKFIVFDISIDRESYKVSNVEILFNRAYKGDMGFVKERMSVSKFSEVYKDAEEILNL